MHASPTPTPNPDPDLDPDPDPNRYPDPDPAPPARVQVRNTKEQGGGVETVPLSTMATFGVGRAASNDLVLRDPAVSACHAQLVRGGGGGGGGGEAWRVSDLGSSNGTCVRLSPERTPSRAFRLAPGHSLLLGLGPKCAEVLLGRFRVGVGERRGKRPTMEDAHVALESLPPPPGWAGEWPLLSFYAVHDGHLTPTLAPNPNPSQSPTLAPTSTLTQP